LEQCRTRENQSANGENPQPMVLEEPGLIGSIIRSKRR
jgi:hypothetical protein